MMDRDRMAVLADAYGGDLGRWPVEARQAARSLLVREPAAASVLARAAALDGALARYRVAPPGAALIGRILAQRPEPRLFATRARRWWGGLGLAGAALAGLAAGATAVSAAAPALGDRQAVVWADEQATAFGNTGDAS